MVVCLERGVDLHMAQLMPLPLTVSCSSKIQIGLTCLVPAHLGIPGQRAFKWVCVCVWYTRQKMVTHSSTNRARCALTLFMQQMPLTTTPRRQRCGVHQRWHWVTFCDPGIQRPGHPVDPVTLFYNELQMLTYV